VDPGCGTYTIVGCAGLEKRRNATTPPNAAAIAMKAYASGCMPRRRSGSTSSGSLCRCVEGGTGGTNNARDGLSADARGKLSDEARLAGGAAGDGIEGAGGASAPATALETAALEAAASDGGGAANGSRITPSAPDGTGVPRASGAAAGAGVTTGTEDEIGAAAALAPRPNRSSAAGASRCGADGWGARGDETSAAAVPARAADAAIAGDEGSAARGGTSGEAGSA
jgi:hypothetical protein